MHPFRTAAEARDVAAITATLADDVTFHSPVAFAPYEGKALTAAILETVLEVFVGFRYVREIGADDASDHALVFEAEVGGKHVTGCDFLHLDAGGLIDDFMVMVRPLSAAQALAAEMAAAFDRVERRAAAARERG